MIYRTDYHIHTTFSDGKGSPSEYIGPAVASGLSEIGFSEHLSLFNENQDRVMNPGNVRDYVDHITGLAQTLNNITIKTGLEIDYIPGKTDATGKFLSDLDLDYRIGSVHYLGEDKFEAGPEFFEGKNIDSLYEFYFSLVIEAASSGLFDIIGHCDLVRIHGFKPKKDPEPLYRGLARAMRRNDVAFELNTNGRNRPIGDFYPDRRFLHVFREEKVPVCVNSDAHMPSRVGQFFDEAYDLLRSAGFTEMAIFTKRKRTMTPLRVNG